MKFGIHLFGGDPTHWLPLVQRADALGYDMVWMSYHLITPMEWQTPYPHHESGRPGPYNPATPFLDPWVAIAAFAATTERIRFGPGVYILPIVNPFVTARAVASAQILSGGRLVLGVGSGWMAEEFDAVGEDYRSRGERMDEILDILELLWTGEPVSYDGKHYQFEPVLFSPKPAERIPVMFGGEGERALRRTALRGDGWRSIGPYERTVQIVQRLKQLRAESGRSHTPFEVWGTCPGEPAVDNLRRAKDDGIDHITATLWPADQDLALRDKLAMLERFAETAMLPAREAGL